MPYIVVMETTIQISKELRKTLQRRKLYDKESYEDVIWDLLEDSMELSEETKSDIEQARKDIAKGRVYALQQVEKEAGL